MTLGELFKNKEHVWNIFYIGVYIFGSLSLLWLLYRKTGGMFYTPSLFDLTLISLATFRIIRLFVYDKITFFIRDYVNESTPGPKKTLSDLMNCPWCIGIWAGTAVLFFYYYLPIAWYFILILSISAVASFIQVLANMVGWRAELNKLEVVSRSAVDKSDFGK